MAEFMEVMCAARRMCKSIDDCADCPLTDLCYFDKYLKEYDGSLIQQEAVIMKWDAENPELRFPTWREWQQENFPEANGAMCPCAFMRMVDAHCVDYNGRNSCMDCAKQHIPADIAQKLGIKPIPVEPQETLVDEYERLRDRVANLNLYLEYARKNYPAVFNALEKRFSGLPGFERVEG